MAMLMEQPLSAPLLEKISEDASQPDTGRPSKWGSVLVSLMLYSLLVVQYNRTQNEQLGGSGTINLSVGLFTLTSALLRKTLIHNTQRSSALAYLLPDWVALLSNVLVFCQYEVTGFLALIFGMFVMGVMVFWLAAQQLFALNQASNKSPIKDTAVATEVELLVF